MFAELKTRRKRGSYALLGSFALHLLALVILLHRPAAIFVRPSFVAEGKGGKSTGIVYSAHLALEETSPPNQARLVLPKAARRVPKRDVKTTRTQTQNSNPSDNLVQSERAGSPFASSLSGDSEGRDIKPALPVVFPDPVVPRSAIPSGVEGRVIVEITIDTQGNVIETRLLQGLGYGIEDKVIAAVQSWRFKPATRDGVAIASQQDVSFHFPS